MKDLHLKRFEANDFMGISAEDPIIIEFATARKGQGVTKLTGDQGVRKTSTLTAIMYLMGAAFDVDTKNFKNTTDETLDVKMEFDYEKEKYSVEASGNRLVLKKWFKEADKFVTVNEPKTVLRKIFGNLGISPMFLKSMEGKKQITWFKETFGTDEEATRKEKKIIESIDLVFNQRRDVNRDIKSIKGSLSLEPLFQNYEKSLEKFKKPVSAEKEKAAYDELTKKNIQFENAKRTLSSLKDDEIEIENKITDLREQLSKAEKQQLEIKDRIEKGEKWQTENKNIPKEYAAATEAWTNLSKTLAEQEKWKGILKKKKELDDNETASQEADGTLDKLRKDLLKLTKSYLPDIEGLEIRVKTGLDDSEEGIYYQCKTLAMLSESELWALFLQIWAEKDVQFVFCENVNSLGSDAIGILNGLVKSGAQVFASEVIRKQKHMEISFSTKVD